MAKTTEQEKPQLWLKKNKIWLWTAVNKSNVGILAWVLGDRSAATFKPLWNIIKCWNSFFMLQMVMVFTQFLSMIAQR